MKEESCLLFITCTCTLFHTYTLIKILMHDKPIPLNTAYTLIKILNICQPIQLLLAILLFGSQESSELRSIALDCDTCYGGGIFIIHVTYGLKKSFNSPDES